MFSGAVNIVTTLKSVGFSRLLTSDKLVVLHAIVCYKMRFWSMCME